MNTKVSVAYYDPEKEYTGTSVFYKFNGSNKAIKEIKKYKIVFDTNKFGVTTRYEYDEKPISVEEKDYSPLGDTVVLIDNAIYDKPDVIIFHSERDLLNHLMTKYGCIPTNDIEILTTDNVEIAGNIVNLFME